MTQCSKCLSDLDNEATTEGVCSVCNGASSKLSKIFALGDDPSKVIEVLSETFRAPQFEWDVCVGISGGVDSCMVATLAGEAGLRLSWCTLITVGIQRRRTKIYTFFVSVTGLS